METVTTTTMPDFITNYLPYTEDEYNELKLIMQDISTHIPNDRMGWLWGNHNKILNTNEPQPCSCGSAAANWKRAAETVRNFISQTEAKLNG
jgi:hypothetical protein